MQLTFHSIVNTSVDATTSGEATKPSRKVLVYERTKSARRRVAPLLQRFCPCLSLWCCLPWILVLAVPIGVAIWDGTRDPKRVPRPPPSMPPPPHGSPLAPPPPTSPSPVPTSPPPPPSPPKPPVPRPPAMPPLMPGQVYAATVEFVLSETHFLGGGGGGGGNRARRALSLTGDVRTTVQQALGTLTWWDLYLHQERISNLQTLWKITLVLPQSEVHNYQHVLADPAFLPQINDHWAHSAESLFEIASSAVKGLTHPPPFAPGTPLRSTAHFSVTERYFTGSHVTTEPAASTETAEITSSIGSTLVSHGLDVQSISIVPTSITTSGDLHTVQWSIVVTFDGEPILISPAFIAAMGSNIAALGGAHANSVWEADGALVTVSRVPV